jgi:hypothetical protein
MTLSMAASHVAGKPTARERGQRYRRKRERDKGKPKMGRPIGSKTQLSSLAQIRELYKYMDAAGYTFEQASAVIKLQWGVTLTKLSTELWRLNGELEQKRHHMRNKSGMFVKRDKVVVEGDI